MLLVMFRTKVLVVLIIFFSNCCNKILNVKTHLSNISDHCVLTCQYDAKIQIYNPKFIKSRNFKFITNHNLALYIQNSEALSQDPEYITNTIQIVLNSIIDSIAPSNKDYCPYYNDNILLYYKLQLKKNVQTTGENTKNYKATLNKKRGGQK